MILINVNIYTNTSLKEFNYIPVAVNKHINDICFLANL